MKVSMINLVCLNIRSAGPNFGLLQGTATLLAHCKIFYWFSLNEEECLLQTNQKKKKIEGRRETISF